MKVDRVELLKKLEAVSSGLSTQANDVEQSSCFVFENKSITTFNGEIFCRTDCEVDIEGALAAQPFLDLLRKLTESEIDLSLGKTQLLVKGKGRRRAGITLEAEITLPTEGIEVPSDWKDLEPTFSDAINVVQQCAGTDSDEFLITCVHITPDYVEATDNFQACNYPIQTGVSESCLVKRDSIKHVTALGPIQIAESEAWLHFKNESGTVLSVRRILDEFPDLDELLSVSGDRITLPGGLGEVISKASIFAQDNDQETLQVKISDNRLTIKGEGLGGFFEEQKKIQYNGDPLSFLIPSKLLTSVTSRTNDCYISSSILKIDGGTFIYVTCLEPK